MTATINETLTEQHVTITGNIHDLRSQRSQIATELLSAGIEADEQTKTELENTLQEAQSAVRRLALTLTEADATKADLDKRIDAGHDSVTPLEAMKADMAVRTTKGKQKPAEAALRKAEKALEPFVADNHLALLVASLIEDLVDVPVLVRKRASDVRDVSDAIVLSQHQPTKGYGTVDAGGRVRFKNIGTTGLDKEALEDALRETGSEVNVFGDVIDFENAQWPVTRLLEPSQHAVSQFADVLSRAFDGHLKQGKRHDLTYAYYDSLWHTIDASLEVTENGKAKGKVVAAFGVDGMRPPLRQMTQFMDEALSNFSTGVHTSAGLLHKITVVELVDAGTWQSKDEGFVAGRFQTQKFGLTIELDFSYESAEV